MNPSLQIRYLQCPLCDGESLVYGHADCRRHALWHEPLPQTLFWRKCGRCAHIFTEFYWSDAGLQELFSNSHADQVAGGDPDVSRQNWTGVVSRTVNRLGGFADLLGRSEKRVWLDVGCGDGALTMLATEAGFSGIGLDARPDTASALKSLGYGSIQGDFETLTFGFRPDVVSMMDVLEHLPFPSRALSKVGDILTDDGVLIISLPNMDSSSWRIADLQGGSPYWIELEHYHNFNLPRLTELLKQNGFTVFDVSFPHRYKSQIEVYAHRAAVS